MGAKYLWIDLETTGLFPDMCHILEVAAVCTDSDLLVITRGDWAVSCPEIPAHCDDFVTDMHAGNGLWSACRESDLSVEDVEIEILGMVGTRFVDRPIIAGASVHFDRKFIRRYMPTLDAKLSHRHFDVSTLRMSLEDATGATRRSNGAHRAMPDILESISMARDVRSWINPERSC
jgi:oligoribonuclease